MLRKFLMTLTTLGLIACLIFTGLQLGPIIEGIDFGDPSSHFTKEEKLYKLTVTAENGGSVEGAKAEYAKGETATLSAVADEGYIFNGWLSQNGSYISPSPVYSFTMDKGTSLIATFVPKPESMEGASEYATELTSCDENFSFTVHCELENAEEYLASVLSIVDIDLLGTEWEEYGKVPFTVTRIGTTDDYIIAPVAISLTDGESEPTGGKYEKGSTYTATFRDATDVSFVTDIISAENELTFSIESEESRTAVFRDDVIFINRDELIDFADDGLDTDDEGDTPDHFTVETLKSICLGSIVCIFSELDENGMPSGLDTVYAKVTDITDIGGAYKVGYAAPELEEVFSALDISINEDINFEELDPEFAEDLEEQLKTALLSNEILQDAIANACQVAYDEAEKLGYKVELTSGKDLLNGLSFKVGTRVKNSRVYIVIGAKLEVPIKVGTRHVADFFIEIEDEISLAVTPDINIKFKKFLGIPYDITSYDIGAGISTDNIFSIKFGFAYDGEENMKDLEENFNNEIKKATSSKKPLFQRIKETFKETGYQPSAETSVSVFGNPIKLGTFYGFSLNFDVSVILKIDINATAKYTSHCESYVKVGVRSAKGGAEFYHKDSSSASCSDFIVSGKAEVKVGIRADLYASFIGLDKKVKAGFGAELGAYVEFTGMASIGQGYYAGYIEAGAYFEFDAYYKLFKLGDDWDIVGIDMPLFTFGYQEAIIGYKNSEKVESGQPIQLIEKSTKLGDIDLLDFTVLDVDDLALAFADMDTDSDAYSVSVEFKDGKNLKYKNGSIVVNDGAPAYFTDWATVTVTPKYNAWTWFKEGKCTVKVPPITIKVVFGNEDSYYEQNDSDIEKEFRRLYRNYNEKNANILTENFQTMVESYVTIPEEQSSLYNCFTKEYLTRLFEMIKEYRALDTDGSRKMENLFVDSEAEVFDKLVTILYISLDGKEIGANDVYLILNETESSVALYDTVLSLAYGEEGADLRAQLDEIDAATKTSIENEIVKYETQKTGNDRAIELAAAFRHVFGLEK